MGMLLSSGDVQGAALYLCRGYSSLMVVGGSIRLVQGVYLYLGKSEPSRGAMSTVSSPVVVGGHSPVLLGGLLSRCGHGLLLTSSLFYTWECVYVNPILPVCLTLPFLPPRVHMSVVYFCISNPALQTGSSVPSF